MLDNLLVPLSCIDMPIETIRMKNDILDQILEQYKKLKLKTRLRAFKQPWYENKPYEYLFN
jgi:hypothetical protein